MTAPVSSSAFLPEDDQARRPLLDIRDLTLELGSSDAPTSILKGVNVSVMPGEILGIVGESGSGKTTLVNATLGIQQRHARLSGSIRFEETELLALSEAELTREFRGKRIGFIPQDPYLAMNPVFTVGKQLLEIMRWHAPGTRREHRARMIEMFRRVRIPDPENAIDRYPHQFSGGQRQRLFIAAALVCRPSLVIADEPTTALDVTTQAEILDLLRELVAEFGISMLFVTHDLGVVAQLCDRVCVMYAGKTVETGRTEQVLRHPSHEYTRALLSYHPENANAGPAAEASVPEDGTAQDAAPARLLEVDAVTVVLGSKRRWLERDARQVRAVDNVSLDMQPGEIFGLVGESGSGKTTLSRTILGLQRESAGTIRLDGRVVSGLDQKEARRVRADIQYVHQDAAAALDPWWSIGRTLEEPLLARGVAKAERRDRIREVLEEVGLPADAVKRYPHEFSGGQLRRITLGRILLLKPRLVILDEPTAGLDMSIQAMVLQLLRRLRERFGLSYLLVSHDLSVVSGLCDRVAIMRNGVIVECSTTARIFEHPEHPYTRALLDAAPTLTRKADLPPNSALEG